MFNKKPNWRAARGLTSAFLAVTVVAAGNLHAQEDEELEAFTVTGSRIARLDLETPSPVARFTRDELLNTGFTNLGDTLRSLPFTSGVSITPEGSSIGFSAGTSTVNLRGLGNNNTLVLINGRRAVPSGSAAVNGFLSVIDINSIPASAIESLEVLKDGASAIYGSDAVAGVINVNLRRDYVGSALEVMVGNTFRKDAFERSAFFIMGTASGNTRITMTADYFEKNAVLNRDYPFSRTADQRAVDNESFFTTNDDGVIVGIDWRSPNPFPARFVDPEDGSVRSFPGPTASPSAADSRPISRVSGVGFYDYQNEAWMSPETRQVGFTFFAQHDISENLYVFADGSYRQVKNLIGAAPAPFTSTDIGRGTNNRLVVPATNPFNPYGETFFPGSGQDIELIAYRLFNAGPRFTNATSDYPRLVAGVGGMIEDWSWEVAGTWAEGSFFNSNPGTAFDRQVQEALDGVNIGGQILFANPFGPEDPRITNYYSGFNPTKTTFQSRGLDFSVSGIVFESKAGPIGLAVGGETRHDQILDVRTTDNETGNVVGGSEGFGFSGDRKVHSLYAELSIPVYERLEFQAAARFEDYSDFGSTLKPKIAARFRLNEWLLTRASYSRSFRAPDLALLYSAGNVSFTGAAVLDPKRPDIDPQQIKTIGRGNPDLQAEEADTFSAGIVLEPSFLIEGLALEVSFFRFDFENLITRDSAQFTLANEDTLPGGRVVRDEMTPDEIADPDITVGRLNSVNTDWYNANRRVYEGIDYALSYRLTTDSMGLFRFGLEATQVLRVDDYTVNSVGQESKIRRIGDFNGFARWRGAASVAWNNGDWAASVRATYIHSLSNDPFPRLRSHILVNPQVSFSGLWNTTITVGFRNVFDRKPPFDLGASGDGYASGIHSPEPRFMYVRLAREF